MHIMLGYLPQKYALCQYSVVKSYQHFVDNFLLFCSCLLPTPHTAQTTKPPASLTKQSLFSFRKPHTRIVCGRPVGCTLWLLLITMETTPIGRQCNGFAADSIFQNKKMNPLNRDGDISTAPTPRPLWCCFMPWKKTQTKMAGRGQAGPWSVPERCIWKQAPEIIFLNGRKKNHTPLDFSKKRITFAG